MAEQILYGVAEQLVTKVGSSAFQKIQLMCGVRNELKKLQDSLSSAKAVILDADEEKQKNNRGVEDWIKRVQEIVYEADDLVDDLATHDLRKTIFKGKVLMQVKDFFSSSNQIRFRLKMGSKINDLTDRLNEAKKEALLLNLARREMVGDVYLPFRMSERETDSYVHKLEVIGREEDKKHMVDQLLGVGGPGNVSTAAIVGFGGLGKTTLAQLVYNDERVHKHFERKIWVCVSEEFDVKLIIKKILNDNRNEVQLEELQANLKRELEEKRYLLVLDDVWNEDWHKWDGLRKYLLVGALGSKILVTTRSQIVASMMGVDSPYELQGLEEDKAWELFKKLAFREGVGEIVNPNLENIGKAIAKKCKGVPLAIKTLGSLMRSKTRESEWSYVLESDMWRLCKSRGDIIPVLKLSYDHLPSNLRQCFAYCAMFPKDYKFNKETLIYLWMAQGYVVSSERNGSLMGTGEQYFNELAFRSFFQFFEIDSYERQIYKMHDLMHDLAQSIAKDSCNVIETDEKGKVSERTQHVYITYLDNELFREAKGMRTYFFTSTYWDIPIQKRVRALHFSWVGRDVICDSIGKLKHLRYLYIRWGDRSSKTVLPNSITNLHNLQTLILFHCFTIRELPRDMQNLINLKSLIIDGCYNLKCMSIGLGKLTGLERLSNFKVSSNQGNGSLSTLEHLNRLRGGLVIEGLRNVRNVGWESKQAKLLEKKHLQKLELNWGMADLETVTSTVDESELMLENLQPHSNLQQLVVKNYNGVRFSNWLPCIANLVQITLQQCLNLKKLPPLDQLPSLHTLHFEALALEYMIDEDEQVEQELDSSSFSTTFFPSLQEIKIIRCRKLMGWWRSKRRRQVELCQFPRLSRLSIQDCENLASLPEGIHQMASLQELRIEGCRKLFERYEKDKGADGSNISHIPRIFIER